MIETTESQIHDRYRRLQIYVGWTDDDAKRIQRVAGIVCGRFDQLVDDFYAAVEREPETRRIVSDGTSQIQRLKQSLITWLEELFSGDYDASYVERRWRVGRRHVEIGLQQVFTNTATSRLRTGLLQMICEDWRGEKSDLLAIVLSLNKLMDLDLAIIEDAYQAEFLKRQQNAERLAVLGQIAGGIAHEMRNPLNVIKTSVYFLRHAKQIPAEKTDEHLARIERQVSVADGVITALADFTRLDFPVLKPLDLASCISEALEFITANSEISVNMRLPDPCFVMGDRRQLLIVFSNLVRNAVDAMPEGGQIEIIVTATGSYIDIAFRDSGSGIPPELLQRIMEPLYSTKARGIGLGLAISQKIVERHGGNLTAASQAGEGATFIVRLKLPDAESST